MIYEEADSQNEKRKFDEQEHLSSCEQSSTWYNELVRRLNLPKQNRSITTTYWNCRRTISPDRVESK